MPEPLATPADLADRLGVTFTGAQETRAYALLDDASAVVRNYTRQLISVATDTAYLERSTDSWLWLPERPVTAVTGVTAGGTVLAAGMWMWQGDGLYRFEGWGGGFYGSTGAWNQPDTIAVTYTHGYAEIPADIVGIVCKLAQSTWLNPQGYRSATAGGVSVTMDSGTVGVAGLDDADKRVLDFYRRPRRSVVLSAGIL